MKERVIRKIGVNAGGLKGLTLSGTQEIIKANKLQIDTFTLGHKHPIHLALESAIEDLRFNVLDVCGLISTKLELNKDEKRSLLEGCEIVSIEFERGVEGWFKIKAASRVFDTKFQAICTPKVDSSDGYEYFDIVMRIIDTILEEVEHYVNKTKVISDEELAISFVRHGKAGGMDMASLEGMSMEEKMVFIEEMCLKNKLLVNMMPLVDDEDFEDTEDYVDVSAPSTNEELEFEAIDGQLSNITESDLIKDVKEVFVGGLDTLEEPNMDVEPLEIAEPIKLKAK